MRYAAAADGNQASIVKALRDVGASVATCHTVGKGFPDLVCAFPQKLDALGRDTSNNNYKNAGLHKCNYCMGVFFRYGKPKFCSKKCSNESNVTRLMKPCERCLEYFKPNTDRNRFCSRKCVAMIRPPIVKKRRGPVASNCAECGTQYKSYPSRNRLYCSYACHIKSGGAQRAGEAALMAITKYGAKKDANHSEIFAAIETYTAVKDLSTVGRGVPDGIAWVGGGWQLFDVKNPKTGYGRRGLNARQKKWINDWRGGPVYLIYTIEEAIKFARGEFEGLKFEASGHMLDTVNGVIS